MTQLETAIKFFYENAGYSRAPSQSIADAKRESATDLANAEAYAKSHGWAYAWEYEQEPCGGCECGNSECNCFTGAHHESFYVMLTDGNGREAHHVLASLGSVCEPTSEYQRVINAELALEAMP